MKRIPLMVVAAVCVIGAVTCGKEPAPTVGPSAAQPTVAAEGNPDGSTLKVTAPVPQSPAGGQRLEQTDSIPLVARNAGLRFTGNLALTYRFRVFNAAGSMIAEAANIPEGSGTTTYLLTAQLEGDQTYGW